MEKQTNKQTKTRIDKTSLNNKGSFGEITICGLKLYCKVIVIRITWYWYRDRQVDKWNRIKDPEINPHIYGYLIFDKEAKNIQWKK